MAGGSAPTVMAVRRRLGAAMEPRPDGRGKLRSYLARMGNVLILITPRRVICSNLSKEQGLVKKRDGAGRFASGLHGCYRKPRTGVTIRQASIAGRLNSEVWRGNREAAHQHSNAPQIEGSTCHTDGVGMGYHRRFSAERLENPG